MIGPLTAFIFLSTFSQSAEDLIPVTMVQPGDSVTLKCLGSSKDMDDVYWYKQTPGHLMQSMARLYYTSLDIDDSFNNERFEFTTMVNQHLLKIRNITEEDEAIYYCCLSKYKKDFYNSTYLVVNDEEKSQKCVHVRQSPSSASVLSGGSVSLQCSLQSKNNTNVQCPPQHKVHWFRAGSVEPLTGVMFNFTNNSCVYSLSKTIGQSSDAGTYHCAVDTCGHILFGDGTRVEMASELHQDPVTVALSVLLSCCVLIIIILGVCLMRVSTQYRDAPDYINCTPRSPCQSMIRTKKADCEAALQKTIEAAETESVYTYVTFVYVK